MYSTVSGVTATREPRRPLRAPACWRPRPGQGKKFVYFSVSYQKDKKYKDTEFYVFCPLFFPGDFFVYRIISIEHECAKDTDFDQVIKEFAMKRARAHKFGYTTV